jgi:hypothetical protein
MFAADTNFMAEHLQLQTLMMSLDCAWTADILDGQLFKKTINVLLIRLYLT